MKPQFRFEAGQLWWRDHHSTVQEMRRVRAEMLSDDGWPRCGLVTQRAELIEQIDTALAEMEKTA